MEFNTCNDANYHLTILEPNVFGKMGRLGASRQGGDEEFVIFLLLIYFYFLLIYYANLKFFFIDVVIKNYLVQQVICLSSGFTFIFCTKHKNPSHTRFDNLIFLVKIQIFTRLKHIYLTLFYEYFLPLSCLHHKIFSTSFYVFPD